MKPKETKLNPPCHVGHLNHVWSQDIEDCYCVKCGILLDNCTLSPQPSPQSWHKDATTAILKCLPEHFRTEAQRYLFEQILARHYEAENKELLADKANLDALEKYAGNIDIQLKPIKGLMMSNTWICVGKNIRSSLTKFRTAIDAAMKH